MFMNVQASYCNKQNSPISYDAKEPDGSVTIVAGGDAGLLAGVHPSTELWRMNLLQVQCHPQTYTDIAPRISSLEIISPHSSPDAVLRSRQFLRCHVHLLLRSPRPTLFLLHLRVRG